MKEIPFYAGMTKDPVNRYKWHYHQRDCLTRNYVRYMACNKDELMKMKIVYSNENKFKAADMEIKAISALHKAGFLIYNRTYTYDYYSRKDTYFPIYDEILRLPHYILTTDRISQSIIYE